MTSAYEVRPTVYGRVIGLGLGKSRFVGSGVGLMLAALLAAPAMAGPQGGKVVQGNATIATHGNRTIIRASNGSIINYTSFNLNAKESVRFIQPGATARVLNRINSDAPTMLDGTIRSNGIVMFANRAGVIFGPNSVLNVGGIYAAAGNISNKDFSAGLNRFTDVNGTVSNAGRIEAQYAALIGDRVINTGTIEAAGGVVTMVAGNEVTLTPRGGVISVKVDASQAGAGKVGTAVENSGTITAQGGSAFMVAGDMYSLAVKNTGTVKARTIRVEGQGNAGVRVSGTLDASSQHSDGRGGSIKVTGKTVDLVGANVDASGRTGGGQILVGGEYQGHGALRTAANTHVDAQTTLNADATGAGNGGRVIVWSDNTTTFAGRISASGGVRSGDGGFIETSGKINLDIRGASITARARAAGGKAGLWMMDPVNVNIDALLDNGTTNSTTGNTTTFDPDNSASPAIVDVATINAALNSGTNVTVITGSVGADAGNITVNSAVAKTAGGDATFTLRAANNINVNATIGSTVGQLNVDLQANASGAGNNDLNNAVGDVNIGAAITTNGGTFSSSGVAYTQSAGGTVNTAGGDASLVHAGAVAVNDTLTTGGTGHVLVQGSSFTATAAVTGGSGGIDLRPANVASDIRINNGAGDFNVSASTLGNLAMAAGSTLTIGAAGGTGTVLIGSSGDIDLSGQDVNIAIRGDVVRFNGALTFAGARSLLLTSNGVQDNHAGTDVTGGTLRLTLASGSASLGTSIASLGSSTVAGDLTIDNASGLSFGTLTVGGNLDLHASGALTGAGDLFVTGNSIFVSRQAGGAAIAVGSAASTFGGTITARSRNNADTADAAGPITIVAQSGVTLAQVGTTGAFALTSGGGISSTGVVRTGNASFAAGPGGNIMLSQLQTAGTLTLSTVMGGNVVVTNSTGITVDPSSFIGGNLTLTATTGNINVQTTDVVGANVSLATAASNATINTANLSGAKSFTLSTVGAGGDAHVASTGLMGITSNVTGTLTFNGGAGVTIASVPTLNLGASIANGFLTITAPDVNVSGTVIAGSAGIILQPNADGKTIGINTSGADFSLTLAEMLNLITSGTVTIGRVTGTGLTSIGGLGATNLNATTYHLTFRGGEARFFDTLTLADDKLLTLHTAGVSSANAGTDVIIGGNGAISIDSTGAVDLNTQIARLAARTTAGSISVINAGTLDVTTVGAVPGVTGALNQDVVVGTSGDLTLTESVAGSGTAGVSLASTAGSIILASGTTTVTSGMAGTVSLTAADSIVGAAGSGAQVTAGTVNLTGTTGDIGSGDAIRTDASTLAITVGGNAAVNNVGMGTLAVSGTGGATSTIAVTHAGVLSIATGQSITGERVTLTAADIDLVGSIVAGNTVTIARTTDGTIGLGDSTGDMTISGAELGRITAATLNIGGTTTTGITGSNISEANVAMLGGINLLALADGADITFTGGLSTLHNATLRADDSINLNADLVSSLGGLTLVADADMAADTDGDKINFGNGITLSTSSPNGGDITLSATGGIIGVGAVTIDSNAALTINNAITAAAGLTLRAKGGIALNGAGAGTVVSITANDGVTISDDLTSTSGLVINSDLDANGMGTFTLVSGKTINTTGSNLSISCADIVLDGLINVGSATVAIAPTTSATIGLGAAAGDIQISGTELSHITAGTLSLGNSITTLISVDSVAAGDTANISNLITFLSDDVDIAGAFNTSSASLAIARGQAGNISLGNAVGGLNLSGLELSRITTHDLQIGGGGTDVVFVNGVAAGDTANIDGTVTILANDSIRFIAAPSTFKALTARANDGITVNANITTTVGDLALDANADSIAGTDDAITLSSGRTLDSAGVLTLRANSLAASTGGITSFGTLTLLAANGITVFDNLTTSGTTTIDADHNMDNTGAFTLSGGRTLSTGGSNLSILASDLVLDGSINANQGSVSIGRSAGGTIGLGEGVGDLTLSNGELGRIIAGSSAAGSAPGLTIGGSNITEMMVDGVTGVSSNGIVGTTRLEAGAGAITFGDTANVFNALDARASGGITVAAALSTDTGNLRLDANSDGVGNEAITLKANVSAGAAPASGQTTQSAFNLNLVSDVLLDAGQVSLLGHDITFSRKVDSATSTSRALVVNSFGNGVTTFNGNVGSTNRLFTLATNNDGITRLGGNVSTNGNTQFTDAVKLMRNVTIDVAAGSGVVFNSTIDTAASSPTARSLTILTSRATAAGAVNFPVISFAAGIGTIKPLQNLFLNYDGTMLGNGRAEVPGIATITARPRDSSGSIVLSPTSPFNMTINTLGTFRMGQNEKFTSAGSLTINAPTAAFLGDLNAIGNLTVNSPNITLQRRAGGRLLGSQGVNGRDDGLDFVSGGLINFTSVPVAVGSGINPRFGTVDGGGDVSETLSGFIFQAFGTINSALINSSGSTLRTLDLRSSGPTNTNIADTIAGAIPRESRQNDVGEELAIGQAEFEQIKQLGIVPRNPTASELVELLTGAATYDDFPRKSPPAAEDYTTVVNRLPSESVTRLLLAYDTVFNKTLVDDDGKPVLDEKGKERRVSRSQEIQDALLASVRRFREASKSRAGDIDPSAFRAFLEQSPDEAVSLGYIRQLADFLNRLDRVGLTARELTQSKAIILNPVRPRGIRTVQQFEAIIRAEASRVMR